MLNRIERSESINPKSEIHNPKLNSPEPLLNRIERSESINPQSAIQNPKLNNTEPLNL
ncbi:hypothetical protein D1AOALGA4SA_11593 [Olavius algarvensis Delta 1 endosymbiont]|nr:hypothetical protein D1AOALGA4SA_11593 [Olavius algarvensis Delta 1 endosymbiont]